MILLLLAGCLQMLGQVYPPSPDYVSPNVESARLDCRDGEVEIEAWLTGSDIAEVRYTLHDEMGAEAGAGDLSPDLSVQSAGQERWAISGIAVPTCDLAMSATLDISNGCEERSHLASWTPPVLSGIDPIHGPETGGTRLTIAIEEGDAEVSDPVVMLEGLGSSTATDAIVSSDCAAVGSSRCIIATTASYPLSGDAETVDVVVRTAEGNELRLEDAFTVHPDRSGQPIAVSRAMMVAFDENWFTYRSPYDSSVGEYSGWTQLEVIFHQPVTTGTHYYDAWPSPGECDWGTSDWDRVSVGSSIVLSGDPFGSFSIPADGTTFWRLTEGAFEDHVGAVLDLELLEQGDSTVPPQRIEDAIAFPTLLAASSFDDPSQPDFTSGLATTIRGEDLVLTWATGEDMDGLTWSAQGVDGTRGLGSTGCTMDPDAGTLSIPWSSLVQDPAEDGNADGVTVMLQFWVDTRSTLPHDGSVFWSRGVLLIWTYITVVDG